MKFVRLPHHRSNFHLKIAIHQSTFGFLGHWEDHFASLLYTMNHQAVLFHPIHDCYYHGLVIGKKLPMMMRKNISTVYIPKFPKISNSASSDSVVNKVVKLAGSVTDSIPVTDAESKLDIIADRSVGAIHQVKNTISQIRLFEFSRDLFYRTYPLDHVY